MYMCAKEDPLLLNDGVCRFTRYILPSKPSSLNYHLSLFNFYFFIL